MFYKKNSLKKIKQKREENEICYFFIVYIQARTLLNFDKCKILNKSLSAIHT